MEQGCGSGSGSGFNQLSESAPGSGSRRAKMNHKNRQKIYEISCFVVLDDLFFEGWRPGSPADDDFFKYWWLMPLYWILISHAILMMVFCETHTVPITYNILLGVLLGGCRLDVDLEPVYALEQNWWVCIRVKVSRRIVPFYPNGNR